MRRAVVSWLLVGVLFVAAFIAGVAALNADLYSPRGFVRGYLDALGRRDAATALAIAGIPAPDSADGDQAARLLTPAALVGFDDIRPIADVRETDGTHTVTFDVTLDNGTARAVFHVEPDGSRFGVFEKWRFAEEPLAQLSVSVEGARAATVNGEPVTTDGEEPFLVLVPGLYIVDHGSTWLEADDVPTRVTEPGDVVEATIEARANREFTTTVQTDVNAALDRCATQELLQPSGCPFGYELTDRAESTPDWSITRFPAVTITPGAKPGEWEATARKGTAHLEVEVRSLFDGAESTLEEDVRFTAEYAILIDDTGQFTLSAVD